MKFIHRLGFYLGGFAVGLLFLAFFLSGKRTSCAYGPEARVLKNIRLKTMTYSEDIAENLKVRALDSAAITNILTNGDVNFKKSDTKRDSCNIYYIEGIHQEKEIFLTIANCENKTQLLKIED
ncbi:MAG: hypothetical protein KJO41_05670 [Bacteroidia bacterium]|nr:hypothetical protein [Bacteroidia bacterium]NND24614.1 hypothetical protein [Flavobacteriaceae bacterium]MBT8278471.1 hypothetical protein [Bacteroidia bacterium]NNK61290.1 hypothetical protein [Flavobacteriaceae bacterium]NNL31844.1 hypothetical protein [Flavobacteriaceae bacterium]